MTLPPPAAIVVGAAALVMVRSALGAVWTVTDPTSSPCSTRTVSERSVPVVLVTAPDTPGSTVPVIVITACDDAARVPSSHSTAVVHEPCVVSTSVTMKPAGSGSGTTRPRASDGPRLSTVIV